MRDLIYYVASSIDAYIAEPDGSFAKFPWDDEVVSDFLASYGWFDTVVMGRKTYQVALDQEITDPYPTLQTIVFSESIKNDPDDNVKVLKGDVAQHVRTLKEQSGKPIWLCGGGNLAGQLFRERLIDKLILKLNPIILGDGIPLFSGVVKFTALSLTKVKEYECGISLRHYDVKYT